MISKSYIAENDDNFFLKNESILFFGENLGLRNDFRKKILLTDKVKIIKNTQEDILKDSNSFYEQIFNTSLFEEKKIFLIEGVNDKILDIFKTAEPRLDQNSIYLFADILEKKSKLRVYFEKSKRLISMPCYKDNILNIKKIIRKQLNSFKNLTNENIDIIADNCNLDRDKLNNELDKIKIYFFDLKLNSEKLKILLNLKINDNFNEIRDEALKGNKIKTNKLLGQTSFEDDKKIFYLNIISQRLNKLADILRVKNNTNLNKLVDDIKPPIFWKEKPTFIEQLRKWNLNKINMLLNKNYNLEIRFKSDSTINNNLLLKKHIVDICIHANS